MICSQRGVPTALNDGLGGRRTIGRGYRDRKRSEERENDGAHFALDVANGSQLELEAVNGAHCALDAADYVHCKFAATEGPHIAHDAEELESRHTTHGRYCDTQHMTKEL